MQKMTVNNNCRGYPGYILNVTSNDTLNTVLRYRIKYQFSTTRPLIIDADGNLTLAANTASGTYTIPYQLCESGASQAIVILQRQL
jgi:hypothetical protein